MSTIIEKISEAATNGENLGLRVCRQPLNLYSLEKRGKPYWVLSWYEGPTRQRKQFANLRDMLDTAAFVIDSLGNGRAASTADEPEELTQVPIRELLEFYKRHHPDLKETFASPTTRKLADEFIAATKKAGRSPRHIDTIIHHLKKFSENIPEKIRRVSVYDLDDYLHSIKNLKTRLNHRITLIALFRFAQRKGYLDAGITAAEQTDRPKTTTTEPEIFEAKELETLLNKCTDPRMKAFLILGGFCGLRSAEICRLRWENVKNDHIIIGADITKTARRRVVEIPDNARDWLTHIRKDTGDVSYNSATHLYKQLKELCESVSIPWKHNALRHSFASYHLEFHRDPPRTSKTAGHSLRILETVYAKLVSREDAIAWFSLFPTTKIKSHEQPTSPRQDSPHIYRLGRNETRPEKTGSY